MFLRVEVGEFWRAKFQNCSREFIPLLKGKNPSVCQSIWKNVILGFSRWYFLEMSPRENQNFGNETFRPTRTLNESKLYKWRKIILELIWSLLSYDCFKIPKVATIFKLSCLKWSFKIFHLNHLVFRNEEVLFVRKMVLWDLLTSSF